MGGRRKEDSVKNEIGHKIRREREKKREREREEQKSVNFFSAPSTYSLIPKQTKVEVREERKKERKRERKRRNLIKVFEIPTADIIPNTN